MTFFRITADDVNQRKKIGSIPVSKMNYYHSFGHTEDYVLFPELPVSMQASKMMMAYPLSYCFALDGKDHIKFHLMDLKDGTYRTFETDHFGWIMHTGNTYIEGDILTVDFEMTTAVESPF